MQAALEHIKKHKECQVITVQSHDGSKSKIWKGKGQWPYRQVNCLVNMKPGKEVKLTRRDPSQCNMKFFVRRALRKSKSNDENYVIQGNLFHTHHWNPKKFKRLPKSDMQH